MDRSKKISNNCGIVRSTSESLLKRTPSSVNVAVAKSDLYLKDTKTFGTSDDHHIVPLRENDTIEVKKLSSKYRIFTEKIVLHWFQSRIYSKESKQLLKLNVEI